MSCGHALESALAALGPSERQLHGATQLSVRCRQLQAFIELHGDIGAEQTLDLDYPLRRKLDDGAIDMRTEGHAFVLDLAQLRQRHDLKSAGVGQNRARPVHEPMQTAKRR